jgi:hypothetical protein
MGDLVEPNDLLALIERRLSPPPAHEAMFGRMIS